MMVQEKFISRLKTAMSKSDVNARELAKRSGLTEASISRYLSGKMEPRPAAVNKIAQSLHVEASWLLGYDPIPSDYIVSDSDKEIHMLIEHELSDEEAQKVHEYIKFLLSQRKDEE